MPMPGEMTPPRYSPLREIASNVVAVPRSTTTQGPPNFSNAATLVFFPPRPHQQRLKVKIALANFTQSGIHGRNHRRDDDSIDFRGFNVANVKQVAEENAIFIHRVGHHGGHTPVRQEARRRALAGEAGGYVLIHAKYRVGVADIKNQKHHRSSLPAARSRK